MFLFFGQMSDPGDLIGLPDRDSKAGKTQFLPPFWFPLDNTPVVLFLDELNRARPEILQSVMDLALNKTIAGRKLPEGSRIISAVNNGDEYQLTDLDPALISRFNIYEFKPSAAEWIMWGNKNGIDYRVIGFIQETHLLGAKDVFAGFEKVQPVLEKYIMPQIALVNDSLYQFFEGTTANTIPENTAENFLAYAQWLRTSKRNEGLAHLANNFTDPHYDKAKLFIINSCPELYELFVDFISEM